MIQVAILQIFDVKDRDVFFFAGIISGTGEMQDE
jgi:hypothetical protein